MHSQARREHIGRSDTRLSLQVRTLCLLDVVPRPPCSTHNSPSPRSLGADTMQRPTMLLAVASLARATAAYPYTFKNCGIEQTVDEAPMKVITMNQGATEFMLAMGLHDHIAGQREVSSVDPIWPRYVLTAIQTWGPPNLQIG